MPRIPYFRELISFAKLGFGALDEEARSEVRRFILSLQNTSGGFCDRAGIPDAYYSLFGYFLTRAAELNGTDEAMRLYMRNYGVAAKSLIENCCLSVIEKDMQVSMLKRIRRLAVILRFLLSGSKGINGSYRYFMVFMALDANGFNNSMTRLAARFFLKRTILNYNAPCPVLAATVVLKLKLKADAGSELKRMMALFDGEQGFKAFPDSPGADLLSTAVSLAALKAANSDIRAIRHTCLNFLQENFDAGAFMAGNGDCERDLEYTFYGLLALGLLL